MKVLAVGVAMIATSALILGLRAQGATRKMPTHMGRTAYQWHRVAVERRLERDQARTSAGRAIRLNRRYERLLKARKPNYMYAITLASDLFGVSEREMLAVASCESGLDPTSRNRSSTASGLFQWLDSTWARAGLNRFSVYDPVANALATARLVSKEGWGEWVCAP